MNDHELLELFPPPNRDSAWPEVDEQTTLEVSRLLREDCAQHHVFYNAKGYSNHTTFHLLTIWSLGGDVASLQSVYHAHERLERPAFESPEAITLHNFGDHLEDAAYYRAYLKYFSHLLRKDGVATTLEQCVFAPVEAWRPFQLRHRLLGGLRRLMHPMLQAAYGLEFGLSGCVAQGLAQAALGPIFTATSSLSPVVRHAVTGIHVFTILSQISQDPQFDDWKPAPRFRKALDDTEMIHGSSLAQYAKRWVNGTSCIADKIEQLVFMNTVLYGVGGWRPMEGFFCAHLYTMHLVTSSLCLQHFINYLSPISQIALLESYLTLSLCVWLLCGRPPLNIADFYQGTSGSLAERDPWLAIIQGAIKHSDDHYGKLQRTLARLAKLYDKRGALMRGAMSMTGLKGVEFLDGTLFLRVAGVTAKKLGEVKEGQREAEWGVDSLAI